MPTRRTQRSDGPVVARVSARPGRPAPWRAAVLALVVVAFAMALLAGSAAAQSPGVDDAQTATSGVADVPATTEPAPPATTDPAPSPDTPVDGEALPPAGRPGRSGPAARHDAAGRDRARAARPGEPGAARDDRAPTTGDDGGKGDKHPTPPATGSGTTTTDPAPSAPDPGDPPAAGPTTGAQASAPGTATPAPVAHPARPATVLAPGPAAAAAAALAPAPAAHGSYRPTAAPPGVTAAASPRTLVARGAAAGLLPFPAHDAVGRRDHDAITRFGLGAWARSARRSPHAGAAPTTAGAAHRPARGPARHGGGNWPAHPPAPLAPPGNAGAGGVAGASGGAATGVWCACSRRPRLPRPELPPARTGSSPRPRRGRLPSAAAWLSLGPAGPTPPCAHAPGGPPAPFPEGDVPR